MAGEVSVMGVMPEVGGLEDSQGIFRKWHKNVGDSLLNLAEGKKVNDEREAYRFQPWPTMVYHADGRNLQIGKPDARKEENEKELKEALARGFRREPYLKPQVAVLDPRDEKAALIRELTDQRSQNAQMFDLITKLKAQVDSIEQTKAS